MDHDAKTLERLMAGRFYSGPSVAGQGNARAEWLKNLEGFTVTSFKYQHLRVTHYGKSVAIACAILRIDGTLADGKPWPAPKTSVIGRLGKAAWKVAGGHQICHKARRDHAATRLRLHRKSSENNCSVLH
jgi:hypothetical protein